jgi:hypothetical protein
MCQPTRLPEEPVTTTTSSETYDDGFSDTSSSMQVDLDGDGMAETTAIDINGDAVADAYNMYDAATGIEVLALDSNGDGLMDTFLADTDGDGTFDMSATDSDGDGQLDGEPQSSATTTVDADAPDAPFIYDETDIDEVDGETPVDDPSAPVDNDAIHGDPMAEIPYHQAQVSDNDCLPTSVSMIVSEITGTELPQGDVVALANELGLLGPDGMTLEGGQALLEHYGINSTVQQGSLDDLRGMLDAGTPIIIGLDSDDLYGLGDQPFADDVTAGHAVVITGIDDEAGLVYINDPGFPDGAGVAIPIDEFEDAWVDFGHNMIVAEGPAPSEVPVDSTGTDTTTGGIDGTAGDTGVLDEILRLVIMPFNLVVKA